MEGKEITVKDLKELIDKDHPSAPIMIIETMNVMFVNINKLGVIENCDVAMYPDWVICIGKPGTDAADEITVVPRNKVVSFGTPADPDKKKIVQIHKG